MQILVSGTKPGLASPEYAGFVGHLTSPRTGTTFELFRRTGLLWAADNDYYSGFDHGPAGTCERGRTKTIVCHKLRGGGPIQNERYDRDHPAPGTRPDARPMPPAIVAAAGAGAEFAWDEFFKGQIANAFTRRNYAHAVRDFLGFCDHPDRQIPLVRITPGDVGDYLAGLGLATPTKKLRLAALRKFFDVLVVRHVVVLNPAASVRAERRERRINRRCLAYPGKFGRLTYPV
jgi:hypothetical protein